VRGSRVGEAVTAANFYQLAATSLALANAWEGGVHNHVAADAWRVALAGCRVELRQVHERLQLEGVALEAVFSLELLHRILGRMELMAAIPEARDAAEHAAAVRRLLVRMVAYAQHDRSVRALASANLRLLHQKVIERAGETGSHYIARDRAEYRHIWLAAAGGGILTTATAAMKVQVHHVAVGAGLPLFVEGLGYSLNYAASFVTLQHTGLMLATKQPAMTAAALATVVRDAEGEVDHDEIVEIATRICSSQVAAAIANVALVAAGCVALDNLWHLATGHHWMEAEEATAVYASMSVGDSLTPIYAALTGVILWLSSLAGGTFDNWSARHRIADGIADLDAPGWIGRDRMVRWGAAWRRHCAGWGTNIALGFMLGFTPILGTILGLPLDVRHVTLNSGILSLAAASLGDGWFKAGFFLWAIAGVATMFVLNLSVSFGLSLLTALRAFDLSWHDTGEIARRLVVKILTKPHHFLLPIGLPGRRAHTHH
jgi:site-specific recombinase